jgi:uncharacterized RDD family membrane protein YckC
MLNLAAASLLLPVFALLLLFPPLGLLLMGLVVALWVQRRGLGHLVTGVWLVRADDFHRPIGFWRLLFRSVLAVILFPGVLMVLCDSRRRALHDVLAGTRLVSAPTHPAALKMSTPSLCLGFTSR